MSRKLPPLKIDTNLNVYDLNDLGDMLIKGTNNDLIIMCEMLIIQIKFRRIQKEINKQEKSLSLNT